MTQSSLATASGVNRVQIADIEAGRSKGSIDTMRRLADALRVMIDDLVWPTFALPNTCPPCYKPLPLSVQVSPPMTSTNSPSH